MKTSALRTWLRRERAREHEDWLTRGGPPLPQRPTWPWVEVGESGGTSWFQHAGTLGFYMGTLTENWGPAR